MKILFYLFISLAASRALAEEVPKLFADFFKPNTPVKAQIGIILPPPEISKYIQKVELAQRGDPTWFRTYSKEAKPGTPLPFHEKLGLTRAEYDDYIALWGKRDFKPVEEVVLLLRATSNNTWTLTGTGSASNLTTVRYLPKEDVFQSPNGILKRLDDIDADPESMLGAWTGKEWRFEEETSLSKIKENFAIGRMKGKPFGVIIYRSQELSSTGKVLLDKTLLIRFVDASAVAKKSEKKPAAKKPVKK